MLKLGNKLEQYRKTLVRYYAQKGFERLKNALESSVVEYDSNYSYDGWDGGQYGYLVTFKVPEDVFILIFDDLGTYSKQVTNDLKRLADSIKNESVEKIVFESMGVDNKVISESSENSIWGKDAKLKVFLSHKNEDRVNTGKLKDTLNKFGISCFVAHQDIEPTQEWQNTIEQALFTMDILVALMTPQFHNSNWTDQEIGCAIGRGKQIISVRLGRDPYGFIGKFQAVTASWESLPDELLKIFFKKENMIDAYIKGMQTCGSYTDASALYRYLEYISSPPQEKIEAMIKAYNSNSQINGCFDFVGAYRSNGFTSYLKKWTGKSYVRIKGGALEVVE